jgi:hypothetical protein
MPQYDDVEAGFELPPREGGHVFDDTRLVGSDAADVRHRMRESDADIRMEQRVKPAVEPAAHQDAEGPRYQCPVQRVAVGQVDPFAVQRDLELIRRLCPELALPEVLEPEVVVALQVADVRAGTAQLGEFGQRLETELGNRPAVLKPEFEQVAQYVERLSLASD